MRNSNIFLALLATCTYFLSGAVHAERGTPKAAATGVLQSSWQRVSLPVVPNYVDVPVLTVPLDKPRLLLKQTITDRIRFSPHSQPIILPSSGCSLYSNGVFAMELMTGSTDMAVPFNSGEVITIRCDIEGTGAGRWTFVFS